MLKAIIFFHVFSGISALISGAFAMYLKKNTPKHKIAGKIYFWNMVYIFVSGTGLSLYRNDLFFLFISVFVFHQLLNGIRAIKHKDLHLTKKVQKIDWFIEIIAAISSIGFIIVGIIWINKGHGINAAVPIIFGIFGLNNVKSNYKKFTNPPNEPTLWLQNHISGMMGSYIGAMTAFLVNQSQHIPLPNVLLWFLPTIIFTPFIVSEIRKIKRPRNLT